MPFVTRKSLIVVAALAGVAGVAVGGFIWSGVYNIGADDMHMRPTSMMLGMMRERSIARHASSIKVPDLSDGDLVRQGAGNYSSMCAGCHLAPGMQDTELSKGLYPAPPNFSKLDAVNPAHAFWVTKHGIKASGMPAWGRSMQDEYIWGMVAFLQQLPKLDKTAYDAVVASSGGHAHGGGETMSSSAGKLPDAHGDMPMANVLIDEAKPHEHAPGTPAHQDKAVVSSTPATVEHRHADGTVESHPAPTPTPTKADDGHDHQH